MSGRNLWTKEELILAFNLYLKLPFGKMHKDSLDKIKYKRSFGKIARMHKNAMENGFISYAEA